jgi:hypothetical protein
MKTSLQRLEEEEEERKKERKKERKGGGNVLGRSLAKVHGVKASAFFFSLFSSSSSLHFAGESSLLPSTVNA